MFKTQRRFFGQRDEYIAFSPSKSTHKGLAGKKQVIDLQEVYNGQNGQTKAYLDWYWGRYDIDFQRWQRPEADSLPCLYSNNDTEKSDGDVSNRLNTLTNYNKKQAECVHTNVRQFIEKVGIDRVGFLTLTFADNVDDHKEAYRRFKSLNAHFISKSFGDWVLVKERQTRGAWHYHMLVDCLVDIRVGFDFKLLQSLIDAGKRGRQLNPAHRSACMSLKRLWKECGKAMPKYGFGRYELMPIRSNQAAIGRYVGKYISKHVGARREGDKGVRLFSTSGGFRPANTKFSWNSPGAWVWRMKVKSYARFHGLTEYGQMKEAFGNKWAYDELDRIMYIELPEDIRYPTIDHWREYTRHGKDACPSGWVKGLTNFRDPIVGIFPTGKLNLDNGGLLFRGEASYL